MLRWIWQAHQIEIMRAEFGEKSKLGKWVVPWMFNRLLELDRDCRTPWVA